MPRSTLQVIIKRVQARDFYGEPLVSEWSNTPITQVITNIPWTVIDHSPTGFEFGYGGSGPADLALNILNAFVPPGTDSRAKQKTYRGYASATALQLHQEFKFDFITPMREPGKNIPADEIWAWIANRNPLITEYFEPILLIHPVPNEAYIEKGR